MTRCIDCQITIHALLVFFEYKNSQDGYGGHGELRGRPYLFAAMFHMTKKKISAFHASEPRSASGPDSHGAQWI